MKSAYELAMERLAKSAPPVKLTAEQKRRLAELEGEYKAKFADREIFLHGQIAKERDKGEDEAVGQLERQLQSDRKSIQAELEAQKEKVRQGK